MRRGDDSRRLIARFAVGSLAVFVLLGAGLFWAIGRQIRMESEKFARFHAEFVTYAVMAHELDRVDGQGPLTPQRIAELDAFVDARILDEAVQRVKIWNRDGRVIFSDERRNVGQDFGVSTDLQTAFSGETVTMISDLDAGKNQLERGLAERLLSSYVPLSLDGPNHSDPEVVVEVFQDYAVVESAVNRLSDALFPWMIAGLGALYLLLFPVAFRAARQIRNQNALLEVQAAELTQHLGVAEKRVAELQELAKLKGEFVANVSHELRTPLTSIIGYVRTLKRPELPSDDPIRDELLTKVDKQAGQLNALVEGLLQATVLEHGKDIAPHQQVEVEKLLAEVRDGFGGSAARIVMDVHPMTGSVIGNRHSLTVVFANLFSNALKFSDADGSCEVSAQRDGNRVLIQVRDTGVGISAEEIDKIFSRFYQVDGSSTRSRGGLGLGLSLVQELLASMDGTVEVVSSPGQGSTFTVVLPAATAAAPVPPDHASSIV